MSTTTNVAGIHPAPETTTDLLNRERAAFYAAQTKELTREADLREQILKAQLAASQATISMTEKWTAHVELAEKHMAKSEEQTEAIVTALQRIVKSLPEIPGGHRVKAFHGLGGRE